MKKLLICIFALSLMTACNAETPAAEITTEETTTAIPTEPVTTTAVTTEAMTDAENEYPPYEPLSDEQTEILCTDYAVYRAEKNPNFVDIKAEDVMILRYYGTHSGMEAVVMCVREEAMTDDENHVSIDESRAIFLPSGSMEILIHTNGDFVEFTEAYEQEIISREDADGIFHYAETEYDSVVILGENESAIDGEIVEIVPVDVFVKNVSGDTVITLSQEESSFVAEILCRNNWEEGTADCLSDMEFTMDGQIFYYHSDCGTFNDNANQRSLSVSGEEKEKINAILKNYTELS